MSLADVLRQIANGWLKAKNETFTNHPIAKLVRQDLIESVKAALGDDHIKYLLKSSPGAGNWADVPWLAILNPKLTTSTQSGVYPVYLFRADGTGVYLSLCFGTTELKQKFGTNGAKEKAAELRDEIRKHDKRLSSWNEFIDLRTNTALGRSYEWASAGAKFYDIENIPHDNELCEDIKELIQIYANTDVRQKPIKKPSHVSACSIPKPFILLAGISGTGKTRFIREQAKLTGSIKETYCLTSVRPDWHEPSDLLGYVSRLSGRAEYVVTDVLKFIVKAWIELKQAGLTLQGNDVAGDQNQQQQVKPFWLCLDEMNLAPVEQYFADYLSVLETRQWDWDGDNFNYRCDPLLKQNLLENIDNKDKLKIDLGLDGCDDLWQHFLENGIGIPFNLIVAGTVNMDETTHGFSRKVIDRALTFDFGEFFPNDFNAFFEPHSEPKALSYPVFTDGRNKAELSDTHDTDGALSIDFLTQINAILHNTPFKLAYRALNELLLTVMIQKPEDVIGLQAVWDDFLMCKVLPRIEGDIDKLSKGDSEQNILEQLSGLLNLLLAEIWDTQVRPDLFQKSAKDGSVLTIECRSKAKLEWMNSQLKNGFTSFWP